ncbi:MAG: hypothetical protein AAGI03_17885, partial [Pseudomonadota bacterium]
IIGPMDALRDPFSRVHPMCWPVLWLSLRAFVRWTSRMIEAGHSFGGLSIEITWYGWIHVEAIDLSEAGKDFRCHMMGEARDERWAMLHRASARVETLIAANDALDLCPWTTRAASDPGTEPSKPALAGTAGTTVRALTPGPDPPEASAPLPFIGRGAAPSSPDTINPRPARAQVLAQRFLTPATRRP